VFTIYTHNDQLLCTNDFEGLKNTILLSVCICVCVYTQGVSGEKVNIMDYSE